jgi:hypothetical protein
MTTSRTTEKSADPIESSVAEQPSEPKRWHYIWTFVGLAVALSVGFWLLNYYFAGVVQTLSQISATSERVAFDVTQPRLAAFHVRAMRIGTSTSGNSRNSLNGTCVEGLITPALRTKVVYGRVGYGPLSIELLPPARAVNQNVITGVFAPSHDDKDMNLTGRTYLEAEEECDRSGVSSSNGAPVDLRQRLPAPLPIWGLASIGAEFTGAQGPTLVPQLLLSGKLTLSANTVPLWIVPPTLYPVTEIDLTVGSRVEAYSAPSSPTESDSTTGDPTQEVNWWGTVYVDDEKPALTVAVATNVPRLALYRPNRHRPDVIEATVLTQIFNDPHLINLYKLLGVMAGSGALISWWFELQKRTRRARSRHPRRTIRKACSRVLVKLRLSKERPRTA